MLPPLREYQQAAVADVFSAKGHVCLVAPTGSGKTRMGVEILSQIQDRAVWVVHRRELLQQARDVLDTAGLLGRVQPITVQSSERPPATTVVLDEAHHYAADDWSLIADTYGDAWRVGLTATPERRDGRGLAELFDRLVVAAKYSDLIRDGHLVPCKVHRPEHALGRGWSQHPIDAYKQHAEGLPGFLFCERIEQARELAQQFSDAGYPALSVDANTPKQERDDAIGALRDGSVKILTNVYALTEGVDVPHAAVCILARNVGHVSNYLQMAGRILRPAPGKTEGIMIDLPGVSYAHGMPDADRVYSLDGRGISLSGDAVSTCMKCGASYPSGGVCPSCGFEKPGDDWEWPRIYNLALLEVYRGAATPDSAKEEEYRRLRRVANAKGFSIPWVIKQFRDLFGHEPDLADVGFDERREFFNELVEVQQRKGFNPKFPIARFKSVFGHWPPREWQ